MSQNQLEDYLVEKWQKKVWDNSMSQMLSEKVIWYNIQTALKAYSTLPELCESNLLEWIGTRREGKKSKGLQ